MCVTCGCGKPKDDHGDKRHLVRKDFRRAAEAAELDMHHVVANITTAYDTGELGKGEAKPEDGKLAPYIQVEREAVERARSRTNDNDAVGAVRVLKSVAEQRYTLGVAYLPDHPDVTKAMDGHRDKISAEELEQAAWRYLRKHRHVGLHHLPGTGNAGEVVESYIWRGPAWKIAGITVPTGAWMLGIIWSPEAWEKVKSGEINGLSPQGTTRRA